MIISLNYDYEVEGMKILNFGSCNIDYVYSLDHIVSPGETESASKLETFPGGKGLNQSIAAARAGAQVYHAGCVGSDGGMLIDILQESGVDVSCIKTVDSKNGHAVIQVSADGENSIFLYPGANEMIYEDYIDLVLEKFGKGDIILLQNEISNIDYIIEKAYQKQMCIILNPSPINEKINKLDFNMLSYIILNEVEAKAVLGCDKPEENTALFREKFPELKVMLTLGSKGCVYTDNSCELRQPAFRVKAVDSTAAGDTFTGYFVAEVSKGTDYREILKIASAAAAVSITRNGAAPSIPYKDEVLNILKELKPEKPAGKFDSLREQTERYIEENIRTANLNELARLLGYSAVYTGSLVKKLTGKSFCKLLMDKRLSEAAKMLSETELPVSEIIKKAGYENESFFRKNFRVKYGENPLSYREGRVK